MKLSEFDMRLVSVSLEERRSFHRSVRFVAALYQRCFAGIVDARGWKVLVECVETSPRQTSLIGGVFFKQVSFSLAAFQAVASTEQAGLVLKTLSDGVLAVAGEEGWSIQDFEQAREQVVDLGYVNEWVWPKKAVASPDKRFRAHLLCKHEKDRFIAYFVITDGGGALILQALAFEDAPSEFCFIPNLGALKWIESDRIALLKKQGGALLVELCLSRPP
jgi:hypothetical protein